MPSRKEKLSNDKPGFIKQESSNVAILHDLMREEPSISAFSSSDSCPPRGCSPNIIENRQGIEYNKFSFLGLFMTISDYFGAMFT